MHDNIDTLLRERFVPGPSAGLAERIIAAARPYAVKKPRFRDGLREIFMIPQPAWALASLLVLGVMAGFYLMPAQRLPSPGAMQAEITSFVAAEVDFYDGGFL